MASLRERLRASARNALEIARFGRLGEDDWASFDVVDTGPHHRLRRYAGPADAPVALLVPPLMLTAEIYDVSPDSSAVTSLAAHGVAPWVVDFGAPERERGGMTRNLDDHIRAVVASIKRVRALTGKRVHLLGYSQGGMFAYQTAAFLHDADDNLASLVTFGSPVDIHKNLPAVRSDLTGAFVKTIFPLASAVLDRMEGLPGKVTSTAFKLVSTRKEIEQRFEFLRSLHDRDRIMKSEPRRRFLGGAGFVAWPGPAFRAFVDEFVVHNRMLSGGFVVDGRTVSLGDLNLPILAFVGATDEIARPATVYAIREAAPDADIHFFTIQGGHFGIVVGTRAMTITWPLVADWIKNGGKLPEGTREGEEGSEQDDEIDLAYQIAKSAVQGAWDKLGDVLASANAVVETVRYQEPRLRRLASIEPDTQISPSRELARRARQSPEGTFFLWRGRAFSFRDADLRVSNIAKGLSSIGVTAGERVGIWMNSRPSLLSTSTALGRLGAVAVIAPPDASRAAVESAFAKVGVRRVVVDPQHVNVSGDVYVLGSGARDFESATDLEAVDVSQMSLPEVDAGKARDLAMYLLRPSDDGSLRAVPVTNHRWALSAIGAAAVCTIEAADTVCCAVPLHHPTGILVSAGAAVAGGARLALIELDPNAGEPGAGKKLIAEIRHVGATVVFYTGEMLRPLLREPADKHLPVRLWAGSGMRKELAAAIRERFGKATVELYAGTAHRAILADAAGDAPGSLGTVLPGSASVELRTLDGKDWPATNEPGLLAVADPDAPDGWLITADVLRRDEAGKYWFVDAKSSLVDGISLRAVEDALYTLAEIRLAVAWSENGQIKAAYEGDVDAERVKEALRSFPVDARRVDSLRLTEGFRVLRPARRP